MFKVVKFDLLCLLCDLKTRLARLRNGQVSMATMRLIMYIRRREPKSKAGYSFA